MLKTLEIKNFRCFRSLSVEDLARVNLVAGRNGAGKTSLREALFLFLLVGGPNTTLVMTLSALRGIGPALKADLGGIREIFWQPCSGISAAMQV